MSEVVPEGWSVSNLGKQIDILSGFPFKSSKFTNDPSDFGLIRIRDLLGQKLETFYYGEYSTDFIVKIGDILIGMDGDFHIVQWKSQNALLNQRICKLVPKKGGFDINFVHYFLIPELKKIHNQTTATTVKHLSVKDIREVEQAFPPLPEQKKIASILTSVDEVIETTQKQINKLQDLKKATMNELLTKGIGHTEFKDSELGRIPKSWEVRLLSEVTVKIGDGIHATPKYSDSGKYPFINGNNLENGRIVINNSTKTVDHLEFEKQRTDLGQKTLLISINGTIGNLAFYNGEKVVLGKSAAYLTFLDNVNLSYAYYLLGSERLRKHFHDELTGTTIKNLSLKSIRSTPIPTPPISEQIEISSVVTSIDKKITAHQQKLSQTQSLKKSLMQDLLTGKVRVQVN